VSQTLPFTHLPQSSIRAGFESAARTHAAAWSLAAQPGAVRAAAIPAPGKPVEAAIASAAERTGVDFTFLLAQARVESAMNPTARAASSSATGLYQFIDDTWLGTMKRHGHRFGLGDVADRIDLSAAGAPQVADPAQRAAILALRDDPQIASLMAAGLAEDNRAHLAPILGRQPDHAELYLAHFLGAGGAGRFLSALETDPDQSAAALFARPAAANRAIFYAPGGAPRSLAQVMAVVRGRIENAGAGPDAEAALHFAGAGWARPAATGFTPASLPDPQDGALAPGTASAPSAPARQPMSQILGNAFGTDIAATPPQVRRAYDRLRALGL
jgi:hypothetical protein